MVNLVEYLIAEHIIVRRGEEWILNGGVADVESGIPESVRQLIERQIDRLTADERRVLEGADDRDDDRPDEDATDESGDSSKGAK